MADEFEKVSFSPTDEGNSQASTDKSVKEPPQGKKSVQKKKADQKKEPAVKEEKSDVGQNTVSKQTAVVKGSDMGLSKGKSVAINLLVAIVVVLMGTGTGYALSNLGGQAESVKNSGTAPVEEESIKAGEFYGEKVEEDILPEPPMGVVLKGGIEGEGSHRILRVGGPTQTVYLTSSFLDLDPYVNHKVKIWGETFQAQKASWLMDVTGVEVLELNAEKPFIEEGSEATAEAALNN